MRYVCSCNSVADGISVHICCNPWFIPRLKEKGLMGKDMNKSGDINIAEMGGLPIIGGFLVAMLAAIAITTFQLTPLQLDLTLMLAALSTILATAIIGIIDDLILISQKVKAVLPVFAALPLMAVKAGTTSMSIPLIGDIDFGIIYPLIIIPIAITGAANATNMLAGFNGLEAGLGVIMCSTSGVIAILLGRNEAAIISFTMAAALLAFLHYNWNPAKILIGDVGTLCIGAALATSVIIGNLEQAGAILILPFFIELYLKAKGKFQAQSWCQRTGNKLICKNKKEIYGIGRLIMYYTGGITESKLVLTILAIQLVFAFTAIASYL